MPIMSSRPDDSGLELTVDELELISAFLYITRLGHNVSPYRLGRSVTPYRDAAASLMEKITDMLGDDFLMASSSNVDLVVHIMDQNGNVDRSVGHDFIEIDV